MIPLPYKLVAVAAFVLALYGIGHHQGAKGVQRDWDASTAQIEAAKNVAVIQRSGDNTAIAIKQSAINSFIEKADHEELAPVVQRIIVDRVRVGRAICGGPAAATKAESAAISDAPDPAGRLVSDQLERDIRALEIHVEEALATGRACQAFITENGLAP